MKHSQVWFELAGRVIGMVLGACLMALSTAIGLAFVGVCAGVVYVAFNKFIGLF